MSAESILCCSDDRNQLNGLKHNVETELLALEVEEENRLCRESEIAIHQDLETDEDSEWLRACN